MAFEVAKSSTQTIFEGTFELLGAIGRGGNSVVYRAHALPDSRNAAIYPDTLALKLFLDTEKHPEENIARVKRESLALLAARHDNVIRVYDYVANPSLCYMTMELAPDGDLKQLLDTTPLSAQMALRYSLQLLRGLEAIHRVGLLHCDVKPENLLLSNGTLKISDFGIAVLPTEKRRRLSSLSVQGTMDYLAPELLDGAQVSPQSDLYSAAVTIYELFTNSLPFHGQTLSEVISAKVSGNAELFRELPPAARNRLIPIFKRALAPQPADRFLNVNDFRRTLESCADVAAAIDEHTVRSAPRTKKLTAPIERDKRATLVPAQEVRSLVRNPEPLPKKKQWNFLAGLYSIIGLLVIAGAVAILTDRNSAEASLAPGKHTGAKRALSWFEGIKSLVSNDGPKSFAQLEPLTHDTFHGYISNLFEEGRDVSLITQTTSAPNEFFVSLGIPGWLPQRVILNPKSNSRRIEIGAAGSALTFWIAEEPITQGAALSGRYRDNATGREGVWALFKSA